MAKGVTITAVPAGTVYTYPSRKLLASIRAKLRLLTRRKAHRALADRQVSGPHHLSRGDVVDLEEPHYRSSEALSVHRPPPTATPG